MLLGFVELPFWASILGSAFIYVVFRFLPPFLSGNSMTGKALATVLPTIAPWAATAILAAGLAGVARRRWRRFLLSRADSVESIRQLDWAGFERVVGEAYRRQGFTVVERGGPQPDGGIDLQLSRGSERIVVQCKHWKNRQVPVQRVRELLGVVTAEGADRGILVATSGFTADAREFAAGKPLELLEGDAVARLAQQAKQATAVPSSYVPPTPPLCPTCGKEMVMRTARRGSNVGSRFWGCRAYPDCRGTRAA
jgi:restriction system protein